MQSEIEDVNRDQSQEQSFVSDCFGWLPWAMISVGCTVGQPVARVLVRRAAADRRPGPPGCLPSTLNAQASELHRVVKDQFPRSPATNNLMFQAIFVRLFAAHRRLFTLEELDCELSFKYLWSIGR